MDRDLKIAATAGHIDMLYNLIHRNPNILDLIDDAPFIETPLHIAASHGNIAFAKEIMRLKPTFARKLNLQGFSPFHVALLNGQHKMALQFLNHESGSLVHVQGREGTTPLHQVVEQGDVDLLAKFLSACPTSIQDVTIYGETALHIAVKNERVEALDILLATLLTARYKGSNIQETVIINWKDNDGKTALHVAATKDEDKLVRLLLRCGIHVNSKDEVGETALHKATAANRPQIVRMLVKSGIKVNAKNSGGLTALDISNPNNRDVERILLNAGALKAASLPVPNHCIYCHDHHHRKSKLPTWYKRTFIQLGRLRTSMDQDTINVMVVVTALILTAAYQAVLSPPGGLWQDNSNSTLNITRRDASTSTFIINLNDVDNGGNSSSKPHTAGKLIMFRSYSKAFYAVNTLALVSAALVIFFLLLPDHRLHWVLYFPIDLFFMCYIISLDIIDPAAGAWTIAFISGCLVVGFWMLYFLLSLYLRKLLGIKCC